MSRTGNGLLAGLAATTVLSGLMMIMVMPMAGAGMIGINTGLMAPTMTLVLHFVFRAVLGWPYGKRPSSATGASLAPA